LTIQTIVGIGESFLQPFDMAFNLWTDTVVGLEEPIVLRSNHFDELMVADETITHLVGRHNPSFCDLIFLIIVALLVVVA